MRRFNLNYELFKAINGLAGHHHLLDSVMTFVSQRALIIYALVLFVMWLVGKEKNKYTVVYAVITGALGLIINVVIGHIHYEARPFVTHKVTLLLPHAADASFPSDHTTGAFSLALAVLYRHRKIGVGMLLFAILTGFSRIYVGHHYPFDVLGSIVVSLGASVVVVLARPLTAPIARMIIKIYNQIPLVPKNSPSENKLNH
jgi:undecaprenyl-diphosphatase